MRRTRYLCQVACVDRRFLNAFIDPSLFTLQDFEALTSWSKKKKDKLVESAASRSKRKPKNDYSWVESDISEDEASGCFRL